jgi:UDP:flavonoid glycosyltransferase YjiC (YdhE family)
VRTLFIAGGSAATVFALAPLAAAVRNAGHEVIMVANDDMVPVITQLGLPAVSVDRAPLGRYIYADRQGRPVDVPADAAAQLPFTGRWFARMGLAWLDPLLELARDWRPELVVGGTMMYCAPLLGVQLGIPYVRHTWDAVEVTEVDPGAEQELAPELAALGLDRLPVPDLLLEVCPQSLRAPRLSPSRQTLPMRWISMNAQRKLEPWMYRAGDRPLVCVTAGSRVSEQSDEKDYRQQSFDFLQTVATKVAGLDTDVVVAAPDEIAAQVRAKVPGVRAGWFPLDVVSRRADLLVHHGGGVTTMTALSAGLAQVVLPQWPIMTPSAHRIARFGAGIVVPPEDDSAQAVIAACEQVLAGPSYRDRAATLAKEIAGLPTPAEQIGSLESLVRH